MDANVNVNEGMHIHMVYTSAVQMSEFARKSLSGITHV